jgi:hypothetical protein
MLAEIFLMRTEAILRASKESTPLTNSRFVPITLPATSKARTCSKTLVSLKPAGRRGDLRPCWRPFIAYKHG